MNNLAEFIENPVSAPGGNTPDLFNGNRVDRFEPMGEEISCGPNLPPELQHRGRCERACIYFIRDREPFPAREPVLFRQATSGRPYFLHDLVHAPNVELLDSDGFAGRPGDIIRIGSRPGVAFENVTVKIEDSKSRELIHIQAIQEPDPRFWYFLYFPRHRYVNDTGMYRITIRMSRLVRKPMMTECDPYELSPDMLRRYYGIGEEPDL